MKRCPQCGRDYNDPTLSFCLDDGAALLDGPASMDEPLTAILPDGVSTAETPTRTLDPAEVGATKRYTDQVGKAPSRRGMIVAGIVGALLVAALGIGGYWFYFGGSSDRIESIAVMPFANESGDPGYEYLSDGMTETLINSLSQIPDVSVKSRSAVFAYKGKPFKAAAVADDLQVNSILSGRVSKQGDKILLNLELIDPKTDTVLWGNNYIRESSQLVNLQSEIARDVAARLRSRLSAPSEKEVTKTYTSNPEAYQDYLKGRFYWNKRTRDDLARSVEFFNSAIKKDPNYSLAYAGLADSYVLFPNYDVAPPKESHPKARLAAEKALELDDSLVEAQAALGLYYISYAWNPEKSESKLRKAIEQKPDFAVAYHWLGQGPLAATGRFDEAIAAGDRAVQLDPLSLINITDSAYNRVYARRFDEAISKFNAALEMDSNFAYAWMGLGDAYFYKEDYKRSIEHYRKYLGIEDTPFGQALLARALAGSGDREKALEIVAKLKERAKKEFVRPFGLALVYGALGDKNTAFQLLDKAFDEREMMMAFPRDPMFDPFRDDPRFSELMRRVKEAKID